MARIATTFIWVGVVVLSLAGCGTPNDTPPGIPVAAGDISGAVRGNVVTYQRAVVWAQAEKLFGIGQKKVEHLSGLTVLYHTASPSSAFDSERTTLQAAGLNFEHIMSTYQDARNNKSPRHGFYPAQLNNDGSVTLVRAQQDEAWNVSSTLTYRLVAPCYVDIEFDAVIHDASQFGPRRIAVFFFASYMNNVVDPEVHFVGVSGDGAEEGWVETSGWSGGNWRPAGSLGVDSTDASFLAAFPWPRISHPYYYGVVGNMVYALLLDRLVTPDVETSFTVAKWKLTGRHQPRPAWDFSYVVRNVADGTHLHFVARAIWKPFISREDVTAEYDRWSATLPPP